jgi:parvulin-like peptidyl-prolyl isomerase
MRAPIILVLAALSFWGGGSPVRAQEVVDRIVARVENDVILLSDVRALGRYQQLVQGQAESDPQILDRLIDQWIVQKEADTARFPHPTDAEINKGVERVQKSFDSMSDYEARKKQLGLSDSDIRAMVAAQLYLSNYLDSRFRPSVQVDHAQVEEFYEKAVVPRAKARGQAPPSLAASQDYIREALIQKGIDEQADRWLNESRSRVHAQKMLNEGEK